MKKKCLFGLVLGLSLTLFASCKQSNQNAQDFDPSELISDNFLQDFPSDKPRAAKVSSSESSTAVIKNAKPVRENRIATSSDGNIHQVESLDASNLLHKLSLPTLRMVYSEAYTSKTVRILQNRSQGEQTNLDFRLDWSDRWAKYWIKANVNVDAKGQAYIRITEKSPEAEALELTNAAHKTELRTKVF